MSEESFRPKITYISKKPLTCPVCSEKVFYESLLSGGGRLIADEITDMLHRQYKPSANFGKIYPLNYNIVVCPNCLYASMPSDFTSVDENKISILNSKSVDRVEFANKICGHPVDFTKFRTLETGAVSFVLAIDCYDYFRKQNLPVIKQAICSMRAAFLFEELNKESPDNYYDYMATTFYKKALFFYQHAQYLNQEREQIMENTKLGPDMDKDYGYDGFMYLTAVLLYKYGETSNHSKRIKDLETAKMYFGKLFGMGKANVNKPKEILDKSKDFYSEVNKILKDEGADNMPSEADEAEYDADTKDTDAEE